MEESTSTSDAPRAPDPGADWTRPLHRIFERRAAEAPDAVALCDGERRVTYRALNRRANQLARHLVARGVRPGDRVALCLERSPELIAAVLAVLKAGAAYLPIDARAPARRVREAAGAARLLVVDESTRHLADPEGGRVVDAALHAAAILAEADGDLAVVVPAGQVAYLMYTSGSTGRPKGVMVSHGNVAALFQATLATYPAGRGDVWTFFHSIAFDFSVWEIFGALLTGGRLVVTPHWTARSPDRFAALIRREGVTLLSQTPSAFQQLLDFGGLADGGPIPLRRVVFGGEAFRMRPLLRHAPALRRAGVELVNMYGITETTVHVTHRVMREEDGANDRSPIGPPLPHLRLHLLDDTLEPVPDGVAGEIHVSGAGVALGYAAWPRATAERFVPSPLPGDAGGRLYRSGDLGRAVGGGDVEYLGRGDPQVKVRGYRIEPGEVRHHLSAHPAVRDALVRAVRDPSGDHVLAAYVVPADAALTPEAVVAYLRERLPEHMVPTVVRLLDRFPLTPNGKVDVAALPTGAPGEERHRFVAPRSWEEEVVADVWRDALGVPAVGIHDDFFAGGGDSIKALRVAAHLRALGLGISIEELVRHPTVARLAPLVARAAGGGRGEPEVDARPFAPPPPGADDAYPLSHLQLGMLFHAAGSERAEKPYHNVSLFRLQGRFDEARFRRAVEALVAAHPVLRTGFELHATPHPLQVVHRRVAAPVTVQRLEGLPEAARLAAVEGWMEGEKTRPFALGRPPLLRFHAAVCSGDEFWLGLAEHHAILDGWSVATLLTELFERYVDGGEPEAGAAYAPAANVFRRYVLLEREAMDDPAHRAFWSERLDGLARARLPALPPADGEERSPGVRRVRVSLEPALTAALRSLAREAGVPLKSVLLAAHVAVLETVTNSRDTVTGLITHGRPEVEGGESGLGLFLNTLPFRMARSANLSWREWLRAVFDEEKRILPFRRYPLALMRDAGGARPELETAFNYTHFHVYERLAEDAPVRILESRVHQTTDFALLTDFSLLSRSGELDLTLSYDAARFGERQVREIAGFYLRAFREMVDDPSAGSCTRPLADAAPAPGASAPSPEPARLEELLAALRDPALSDRVALVDEGRHLTYRALRRTVDRLAAVLAGAGVGPDVPVALLLEKSLEWVAATLAVWEAGGAAVPVDPADPAERVNYVIGNAGASVVVAGERGARLPDGAAATVIPAGRLDRLEAPPGPRPRRRALPGNLAYVIYTSGSTGRPKGVAMHREGIASLMRWQRRTMPLEGRRILQYASTGFDVSVQEIITAVMGGNTLVVVPAPMRRDFVLLARRAAEEQVECVFAPDTALQALMTAAEAGGTGRGALATIVHAGEALRLSGPLRRFVQRGGRLFNHYGPTETHVVTACRAGPASPDAPPIGAEVDDTRVLVVDSWLRPCPAGTIGELLLASAGVARGYHAAPGMTADRFRPSPHPRAPGERVFRTGDLGFRDAEGTLWYTGRADGQVKLRGYRIELDEVRHAFLRHPAVRDAVVSVVGADAGRELCVHVVADGGADPAELRRFVGAALPGYMVPAHVVPIDHLPVTRNGKVDRARLPGVGRARAAPSAPVEPRGEAEAALLELWREVLAAPGEVSADDDFLEIGGSSISLLQLQLRIEARFGVELRITELAAHSTFGEMSLLLARAIDAAAPAAGDGPEHAGGRRPAPALA